MTKISNFSLMILLTFFSLAHGQDASVVPPTKGSVKPSSGQDGATDQKEELATLFPVTVYGPHQKLEIDPAEPPHAVAAEGRLCSLRESPERLKKNASTHIVSGVLNSLARFWVK